MKYAYFKCYVPGDEDEWIKISQKEYDLLAPHSNTLALGNCGDETIGELVWAIIKDRPDLDLRKKEIEAISDDDIIEIAIC